MSWARRSCCGSVNTKSESCKACRRAAGSVGLLMGAGAEGLSRGATSLNVASTVGLGPQWGLNSGSRASLHFNSGAPPSTPSQHLPTHHPRSYLQAAASHRLISPPPLPPPCRLPHHIMSVDVQGGRIYVGDAQVSACGGGAGGGGAGEMCLCGKDRAARGVYGGRDLHLPSCHHAPASTVTMPPHQLSHVISDQ